jgi:hypothetical protein
VKTLSTVLISAISLVAMAMSFHALDALGVQAGFGALSAGLPVIVDGASAIGALATVVLSRNKNPRARAYPWIVVGVFTAISIAANMAHASGVRLSPSGAALLGAVPPIAALASLHLVLVIWHHAPARATKPKRAAAPVATQAPEAQAAGKLASVTPRGARPGAAKEAVVSWAREQFAATGEWPSGPVLGEKLGQSRKSGARLRAQLVAETV